MIQVHRAAWVSADRASRRFATAGSRSIDGRIVGVGSVAAIPSTLVTAPSAERQALPTIDLSPSCPAWSTRTPISSCRGCAGRCRRRGSMPEWASAADARSAGQRRTTRCDGDRRGDRRSVARPGPRSSATSATRSRRFAPLARQRAVGGRVPRAARVSTSPDPAQSWPRPQAQLDALTPVGAAAPDARRRTRRTRCRRRCFRAIASASTARRPCQRPSRRVGGGGRVPPRRQRPVARRCSSELGAWNPAWTPPGAVPSSTSSGSGSSTPALLAVHGVQMTDAELARLARARRDARHLPAQQRLDRRRRAADRAVLRLRRARRDRHRQPGERRRPERVRRAGRRCDGSRPTCPRRACSTARRSTGAARLGFEPSSARSSPASARRCSPSDVPPGIDDVEEYLVSGIDPRQTSAGCKNLEPVEPGTLEP